MLKLRVVGALRIECFGVSEILCAKIENFGGLCNLLIFSCLYFSVF